MKIPRWTWLILILILVVVILLPESPRFRAVPPTDPAVYLYTGQAILDGGAPYISAWDHKQPLTYLVFALSLLLTPHSIWGIWILELIGLAVLGLVGFRLLEKIAPPGLSFLATAAALLTLRVILWGYSVEELSLPLQMIILLAFANLQGRPEPRRRIGWGLAAGIAASAAFFLKQSLIAAGLALGVYLLLEMLANLITCRPSWRTAGQALAPLGGMVLGAGLVAAPLLAYLGRAHALTEYWNAAFGFNLAYSGLGPKEYAQALLEALEFMSAIPGLFLAGALWLVCLLLAVLQAGPLLARAIQNKAARILVISAGAGLVALSLAAELVGREPGFGLFQWLAVLGGAVLLLAGLIVSPAAARQRFARALAAAPVLSPAGSLAERLRRALLYFAALYFPAILAMTLISGRNYTYYFIPVIPFLILGLGLVGSILLNSLAGKGPNRLGVVLLVTAGLALAYNPTLLLANSFKPSRPPQVIDYITRHTSKADTILVWGSSTPYIYFLADRRAPTRYFYVAPVALESYNQAHQVSDEILRSIQAAPPRLFIIPTESKAPPAAGTCPWPSADTPNTPERIFQYICAHYQYAATVDDFMVYAINP